MNKKILALALSLIIAPAFVSAQSVYKWTDEEGVTHFGDRQPIGQQSESISIRTGRQSSSDRASPQERVRQINEQQAEAAESEAMTAAEEARQKQRSANCQTATSNLSLISSGSRIKVQEDGEERFLTDEEIAEKREQFEDIAEANCGN
jgi:RNA 3'-terminal phosphate cyclase